MKADKILKPVTDNEIRDSIKSHGVIAPSTKRIANHFKKEGWKEAIEWLNSFCREHSLDGVHRNDCCVCQSLLIHEIKEAR